MEAYGLRRTASTLESLVPGSADGEDGTCPVSPSQERTEPPARSPVGTHPAHAFARSSGVDPGDLSELPRRRDEEEDAGGARRGRDESRPCSYRDRAAEGEVDREIIQRRARRRLDELRVVTAAEASG